jgi:nucleoid-associated protein EbfC
MSKGKVRGGFGGGMRPPMGTPGGNMMAQVQKLQEEMAKAQELLGEEKVEATAGGGSVKAVMTGHQVLVSLTIAKEAVDPEDVEMLQDLIVAVINEAVEKSKAMGEERMQRLTGGISLPGIL